MGAAAPWRVPEARWARRPLRPPTSHPARWGRVRTGSSGPSLRGPEWVRGSPPPTENKLEKNEEAALLSWEIYLKENYLQDQQIQQKQRPEQKIQDISDKYGTRAVPSGFLKRLLFVTQHTRHRAGGGGGKTAQEPPAQKARAFGSILRIKAEAALGAIPML